MDLRVLGPLEVWIDGHVVPIRPGLPRKLFVMLVLRLGERVSTDTLVEVLWHADPPANPANALQILVSYLRKSLSGAPGGPRIETVDGGYRLSAPREAVDAYRLEAAASPSSRSSAAERLETIDRALGEWRGPPIPEMANEEVAQPELHRLDELRLAVLEQRAAALLELERYADAAVELQGLVLEHPFRERFYVQLMEALYRSGRQVDALGVYERARTTLREELGLDPGPELRATERVVLRQEPLPHRGSGHPPLADPDLSASAGADRTHVEPDRSAFPRPLEALIGREREVTRLRRLMESRRMITLTGPGGAGKTRLAAELAATASTPVWWVDLSAADTLDAVLTAVAGAVGVATQPGDDGSALAVPLTHEVGLLVLDTCERVRTETRRLAEALLGACRGLAILATSRQPLGAATELAWPVPPLSLPHPDSTDKEEVARSAAVQLFVERAANRRDGFELTNLNCRDVAHVCLVLDGLPLAIELAAAHAAALDPASMLRVLDDRLRLLVDDARDDRQHTLRSTIAWSYDLLSPDQSVFFERLSVFAAPFPLEGAIAVAGEGLERDGLELLLALTRQSLVAVEGDGRYRLLDTIRAFARGRLREREGETEAAQRRHAAWYADLLQEAAPRGAGPVVEGWRGDLRGAMPDLIRALEWCFAANEEQLGARLLASLWWLWPREGVLEEAARWFARAKGTVSAGTGMEAALLASSGTYAVSRGDLATAARDCAAAAAMYDAQGDERGAARSLLALGIARWGQGGFAEAGEAHDRAASLFERLGDHWGAALSLVLRARTALDAGEGDAEQRLAVAELRARGCGDQHVLAAALVQHARAELARGEFGAALRHAEESLALNDQHGHREGAVGSLHAIGLAWLGRGEHEQADRILLRALTTALTIHHAGATAESLDCLAIVACRQLRWTDAAMLLAAADNLRSSTGIQRSRLVSDYVGQARAAVSEQLGQDASLWIQLQGQSLDPARVAADQRARLARSAARAGP